MAHSSVVTEATAAGSSNWLSELVGNATWSRSKEDMPRLRGGAGGGQRKIDSFFKRDDQGNANGGERMEIDEPVEVEPARQTESSPISTNLKWEQLSEALQKVA